MLVRPPVVAPVDGGASENDFTRRPAGRAEKPGDAARAIAIFTRAFVPDRLNQRALSAIVDWDLTCK